MKLMKRKNNAFSRVSIHKSLLLLYNVFEKYLVSIRFINIIFIFDGIFNYFEISG